MTKRSFLKFTALILAGFFYSSVHAETLTIPQTSYQRCTVEKQAGSCYELGSLYQQTSKPGDIALGDQYVRYGCKLETKQKCTQAVANKNRDAYLKQKKDWEAVKQKALLEIPSVKTADELSCENGKAEACSSAGNHYFFLAKVRNPAKGEAMFQEGCRLGDKDSCGTVGLIKKGIIKVYDVDM